MSSSHHRPRELTLKERSDKEGRKERALKEGGGGDEGRIEGGDIEGRRKDGGLPVAYASCPAAVCWAFKSVKEIRKAGKKERRKNSQEIKGEGLKEEGRERQGRVR